MGMKAKILLLGMIFGFTLTQVRASEYDMIHGMFVGTDLKIAWVILTAIAVGAMGMRILRLTGNKTVSGQAVKISLKPIRRGVLFGAALFGTGWGLSGACPGTVLAQIGSGRVLGLFTLAGMLLGTYAYALLMERR